MKDKIIDTIMININNKNNLDKIKQEEIRYGLLGLYTLITKTSVILIISLILNMFYEFIIFLLFYSILRSIGYGCHAKTNLACWVLSPILLLGIPYLFVNININLLTKITIYTICFINYIIFCPADTEKRPMINKVRKLKYKIVILLISLLYIFIIIKFNNISNLVIGAMVLEALLTNPLGYLLMGQKVRFQLNDLNIFNLK